MASTAQQIALVQKWQFDPQRWAREMLGFEPTTQQKQAFDEWGRLIRAKVKSAKGMPLTDDEKPYVSKMGLSIMSGHHTGKDAFASVIALHFLTCWPYCKIRATAPAGPQLESVLWPELHKWIRSSELKEAIQHQATKIFLKEVGGEEWFIEKRTIQKNSSPEEQAEALGGLHERYVLYIADEASGIPDAVFRPIEGGLGGVCNLILMIFNPTRASGFALESQQKFRKHWACLHWNAEDLAKEKPSFAPNLDLDHQRTAEKYGRDSNFYRVRVQGLPPLASTDTLIAWELANDATERDIEPLPDDPLCLGVDVARFGEDKTIILPLVGSVVDVYPERNSRDHIPELSGADGVKVSDWTAMELQSRLAEWDRRYAIAVDVIGVGASVYDHLRHYSGLRNIHGVNTAEAPSDDVKFHRLRDQLLWGLREEFENRTNRIPKDDELFAELTTIKWDVQNGKIKVEGKKELRKRGLASPNKLDAYALALYARRLLGNPGLAAKGYTYWRRRLPMAASPRTA